MKIQYAGPKVVRFDLNEQAVKERIPLDNTRLNLRYEYGVDNVPEKHIWIGLRVTAHIQELQSKKEFLGYIMDFRGIALPEDKQSDLKDLTLFVKNALLNFQAYFQNNASKEISSFQLFSRPNEQEYAQNLLNMISDDGIVYG